MGFALLLAAAMLCVDAGPPPWLPRSQPVDLADRGTYPLRPSGDGYVYVTPRFVARVARDGAVTFGDKHGSVGLSNPVSLSSLPRPRGPTLESTLRDAFGKRRRKKPEPPAAPPPPAYDRKIPQMELCPPSSSCYFPPSYNAIEVRGSSDLTDEIMRAYGQDPYRYEKARFLSATFEFRIKMAIEARKADLKASLAELPRRLDELLVDERYSPRERRRILYELWHETDQTPEGEKAAASIVDFIRRRLPCGSATGYVAGELDGLARLHPERRFPLSGECDRLPMEWAPSTGP
jgi:hypothetical protein